MQIRAAGGGDLVVRAGRNIDGGVYYLERGVGSLAVLGAKLSADGRTVILRTAPLTPGAAVAIRIVASVDPESSTCTSSLLRRRNTAYVRSR